ncbi:hypothetical protein KCP73_04810 [Salmonella enterica subsp. enterica]|nr:hypothetical protein KCP73_04810 [Salmonella enterica subsp. enterica]
MGVYFASPAGCRTARDPPAGHYGGVGIALPDINNLGIRLLPQTVLFCNRSVVLGSSSHVPSDTKWPGREIIHYHRGQILCGCFPGNRNFSTTHRP